MIARVEQETTVTWMRDDDEVSIYTSNFSHLHHLRKLCESRSETVREVQGGADWGDFRVRSEFFNILRAIRSKRATSDAQRAAAVANVAKARAAREAVAS